ncbi:MAG: B12-binding domain-containing radical SAM protein [Nitrospinae bacterium]|nr:B12-binding domain-containing radical SAM protein [Nitrospinota bacterium]
MKVTLISPYPDITAFGLRTLSAHLRAAGFKTRLLFLPDPFGDDFVDDPENRYPASVMNQLVALCEGSQLIGVTLMTNFFDGASQITRSIKGGLGSVPVIWGGVHPTIRPDECMEIADMVCVGDGEDALLELTKKMAAGQDYSGTPNLWVKRGGEVIKNPLSPLPRDLDIYPAPDYSMEDHFVLVDGDIKPLDHDIMERFLKKGTVSGMLGKTGYQTMTSRGCPYACTYCINDTVNEMYGGKGKLRWRSVGHVMEELSWARQNMPYVDFIWISDDEFFARKLEDIREFCVQYKEKIGVPFSCLVSPLTVSEDKMGLLVDAGLVYVQMGVESGSARMQELYRRKNMNNTRMIKAMRIINSFKDKMAPPSYDFLLDAPEETDADRIESLRLIADIPKPFRLQPFRLILYPGTQLHKEAMDQGLIKDERAEIYRKTYTMREPTYLNLLITLAKGGKMPGPLLKALVSKPVAGTLNSQIMRPFIKWLYILLRGGYHLAKATLG